MPNFLIARQFSSLAAHFTHKKQVSISGRAAPDEEPLLQEDTKDETSPEVVLKLKPSGSVETFIDPRNPKIKITPPGGFLAKIRTHFNPSRATYQKHRNRNLLPVQHPETLHVPIPHKAKLPRALMEPPHYPNPCCGCPRPSRMWRLIPNKEGYYDVARSRQPKKAHTVKMTGETVAGLFPVYR
jgi:hypothetical protein